MPAKTVTQMLADANAVVPAVSVEQARPWLDDPDTLFLDVRPHAALRESGTVAGALHIPRGLLEFQADPSFQMHNPAMDPAKRVVVFCALGGQAALAGKTLKEMGYQSVYNGGGIQAWIDAGVEIAVVD